MSWLGRINYPTEHIKPKVFKEASIDNYMFRWFFGKKETYKIRIVLQLTS